MHPLVRDLYKRALLVGRDYPLGLDYVRTKWKEALRNPKNCPSCYTVDGQPIPYPQIHPDSEKEKELRKAVGKGRYMVREMVALIQLKKYRTLKERYSEESQNQLQQAMKSLEGKQLAWR
jgi:hypothetical protein